MEPHELAIAAKYVAAGLAAVGTAPPALAWQALRASSWTLRLPSAVEGRFGRLSVRVQQ